MSVPGKQLQPKDREKLWTETKLLGIPMAVAGLGILVAWVWHSLSADHVDHEPEVVSVVIGAGLLGTGLWFINQKLTKEWLTQLAGKVPFLDGGES